ncbi:MAG: hypothetical protein J6V40_05695, partial [Clostridia bacterium]|nr:hypothetical protein [Clostridia bacterium]
IVLETSTNGNMGNPQNYTINGKNGGTTGYVSGLIGSVLGSVTLTNAYNYHKITSYGNYVAGLVGYCAQNVDISKDTTASASNEAINAYNSGAITSNGANGFVGGIFGRIDGNVLAGNQGYGTSGKVVSVYVTNSSSDATYSNGKIVATGTVGYVGAIAGSIGGSLTSSTGVDYLQLENTSTVTANQITFVAEGDTGYVSGGIGYIGADYTVTKAINTGDISSTNGDFVGGIIGQGDGEITIQDVVYSANVIGRNYTAGGIGNNTSTVGITVSTVTSNTDGDDYVTGYQKYIASLVGQTMGNLTIETSMLNDMPIRSNYTGAGDIEYVAGVMGSVEGNVTTNQITNAATGVVSTLSGTNMKYVAGIAGNITGAVSFNGEILNDANVNATAASKVVNGQYIGGVYGNVTGDIVANGNFSFTNNGNVGYYNGGADYSAFTVVGGIVGQLSNSGTADNIMSTYNITNTGNIYGVAYTAGLVAISNRNIAIVNKADNSGDISSCQGAYVAGGIAYMDAHELRAANTEFVNTGNVRGTDNFVAGIIGEIEGAVAVRTMTNGIDGTATVVSSTNAVTTNGEYVSGGIGYAHDIIEITESLTNYADITTVSTTYVAGLVGRVTGSVEVLQTVQNYGNVNGVDYVSGGIAYAENTVAISSIINGATDTTKTIVASGNVGYVAGGVARGNESLTTLNMLNNMDVTANNAANYVAGLVASINDNDTAADAIIVSQVSTAGASNYENNGNITTSANHVGGVLGNVVGNVTHSIAGYTSTYTNTGVISSTGTTGFVGGVAANIMGTFGTSNADQVTNISNTGNVTSSGSHVAGNVAYIQEYTYIVNSSNDADVTGLDYIAGIVGDIDDASNNTESYIEIMLLGDNTITSTASVGYVAGAVAKVDMSFRTHEITATKTDVKVTNDTADIDYVSGVLGAVDGDVTIEDGSVVLETNVITLGSKNIDYVAGVGAYITGAVNAPEIDITISSASGYIGYQTYNGNLIQYIGGVFGYVQGDIAVGKMYNENHINGAGQYVAGLVSMIDTGALTFKAGANTGNVTSSATGDYVAGLVGYAGNTMDVTDSIVIDATSYTMYNTGTINAKGSYVGGAVGAVLEDVTTAGYTIYNTGEVTAETGNYVGGLFGLFDSTANFNYDIINTNNVTATGTEGYVGGIAGQITEDVTIAPATVDVHNTGDTVTSEGDYVGGLFGIIGDINGGTYAQSNITASDLISEVVVSGSKYVAGLIGKVGQVTLNSAINLSTNINGKGDYVAGLIANATDVVTISGNYVEIAGETDYAMYNAAEIATEQGDYVSGGIGSAESDVVIDGTNVKNIGNVYTNATGAQGRYISGMLSYVGGSVVKNASTVTLITNTGNINTVVADAGRYIGGIAGYIQTKMQQKDATNSFTLVNTGNVYGQEFVGGVAGVVTGVTGNDTVVVNSMVNTGTEVIGSLGSIAGLVGRVNAGITTITGQHDDKGSLYNSANVTGAAAYVSGGIAYHAQDMSTAANVTNTGVIKAEYETAGDAYAGGIIGLSEDSVTVGGVVSNTGNVSAKNAGSTVYQSYVGGIAGRIVDKLTQTGTGNIGLSNVADITGGGYVGGIAGRIGTVEVTSMSNAPSANGVYGDTSYVAGIVGLVDATLTITDHADIAGTNYAMHNTSNITSNLASYVSGGFASVIGNIRINGNMYNAGNVITEKTDAEYMAGIIAHTTGEFINSTRQITMENHGNIGEETKLYTTYAGGIIGYTNKNVTQNSETNSIDMLNNANVYGVTYVGGVIGENVALTMGSMINTGNTVLGVNGFVAGLVGDSQGSVTLTNSVAVTAEADLFEMYNKANVTNTEGDYISGGIAKINGTLTFKGNLYNSGAVTSTNDNSSYVGGIVGYVTTNVVSNPTATIYAKNEGNILASGVENKSYVAGVIGLVDGMVDCDTYTDFVNTSNIYGTDYVAGVIGKVGTSLAARTLSNIGTDTTVTANANYVAGLVGYVGTTVNIDNANANGVSMENLADITTNSNYVSGGIAYIGETTTVTKGAINAGDINNSTNTEEFSYTGGILGFATGNVVIGSMVNSASTIATAGGYVGGLIATISNGSLNVNDKNADNFSLKNTSVITNNSIHTAGFVGNIATTLTVAHNGENTGNVTVTPTITANGYISGGFGYVGEAVTINGDITNTGDIITVNDAGTYTLSDVGGVIGHAHSTVTCSTKTLTNKGTVTGMYNVGGIIGRVLDVTIIEGFIYGGDGDDKEIIGLDDGAGNSYIAGGIGKIDIDTAPQVNTARNFMDVTGTGSYVAGIFAEVVDETNGIVFTDLYSSSGEIEGGNYVAGIVGNLTGRMIIQRTSIELSNNITGVADIGYVGGIAGRVSQYVAVDNTASIKSIPLIVKSMGAGYIGGLFGSIEGTNASGNALSMVDGSTIDLAMRVEANSDTASIIEYIGGVAGYVGGSVNVGASHIYLRHDGVDDAGVVAGFGGEEAFYQIGYTTYHGNIINNVGGIFGYVAGSVTGNNMEATNTVKGAGSYIAGLFGQVDENVTITNIVHYNDIESVNVGSYVAGAIGYLGGNLTLNKTSGEALLVESDVTAQGSFIAGAVGYIGGVLSSNANIDHKGNISSQADTVGHISGVIGKLNSTLSGTQLKGDIKHVGSIVATANTSATGFVGGVIGQLVGDLDIYNQTLSNVVNGVTEEYECIEYNGKYVGGLIGFVGNEAATTAGFVKAKQLYTNIHHITGTTFVAGTTPVASSVDVMNIRTTMTYDLNNVNITSTETATFGGITGSFTSGSIAYVQGNVDIGVGSRSTTGASAFNSTSKYGYAHNEFSIDAIGAYTSGVFGYIGGNLTFDNIMRNRGEINVDTGTGATTSINGYIGGIAGYIGGNVSSTDFGVTSYWGVNAPEFSYVSGAFAYVGGSITSSAASAVELTSGQDDRTNKVYAGTIDAMAYVKGREYAGGAIGYVGSTVNLKNIYFGRDASINGTYYVAGGIAYANNTVTLDTLTIGDVDNVKDIIGTDNGAGTDAAISYVAGGIGKYVPASTPVVRTAVNYNNVSATGNYVAGIYAETIDNTNGFVMGDAFNNHGEITGANYVGGITGKLTGLLHVQEEVGNHNHVTGTGSIGYVGGIAGEITKYVLFDSNIDLTGTEEYTVTSAGSCVGGWFGSIDSANTSGNSFTYMDAPDAIDTKVSVVSNSTQDVDYIAGIAGYVGGNVENTNTSYVSTVGTISSNSTAYVKNYVGGLYGHIQGNIEADSLDIYKDLTDFNGWMGGIIGKLDGDMLISAAKHEGTVTSVSGDYVGGVMGTTDGNVSLDGYITVDGDPFAMHNKGNVTAGGSYIGGCVGHVNGYTVATSDDASLYNEGDVTSTGDATTGYVGGLFGIIGENVSTLKGFLQNKGDVTATAGEVGYVGGIAGQVRGDVNVEQAEIKNTGEEVVSNGDFIGGLFGEIGDTVNAKTASLTAGHLNNNDAKVTGKSWVGGLIGSINGTIYAKSITNQSVDGSDNVVTGHDSCVGGLVGATYGSIQLTEVLNIGGSNYAIYNNNSVNVTAEANGANEYISGCFGYIDGDLTFFGDAYNKGNVTGVLGTATYVGGIVGYTGGNIKQDSTVDTTFENHGNIVGKAYIGGIAGYVTSRFEVTNLKNGTTANEKSIRSTCGDDGMSYVAGCIGYINNNPIIDRAENYMSVEASGSYVAGLFSFMATDLLINNAQFFTNEGNIYVTSTSTEYRSYVGGFFGSVRGSLDVNQSAAMVNKGIIDNKGYTGNYSYVGGIAGYVAADALFNNPTPRVENAGEYIKLAQGAARVGGIVGHVENNILVQSMSGLFNYASVVISNYTETEIATAGYIGGIAGYAGSGFASTRDGGESLHNLKHTSTTYNEITGCGDYVGGLIGYSGDSFDFRDLKNEKSVKGYDYVGGLIGAQFNFGTAYNSTNSRSDTDTVIHGHDYVGGFYGYVSDGIVMVSDQFIYNYADLDLVNESVYAGGFAGYIENDLVASYVEAIENHGDINYAADATSKYKNGYVGGFIGRITDVVTRESYYNNYGSVYGGYYVGGCIGYLVNEVDFESFINGDTNSRANGKQIRGYNQGVVDAYVSGAIGFMEREEYYPYTTETKNYMNIYSDGNYVGGLFAQL